MALFSTKNITPCKTFYGCTVKMQVCCEKYPKTFDHPPVFISHNFLDKLFHGTVKSGRITTWQYYRFLFDSFFGEHRK